MQTKIRKGLGASAANNEVKLSKIPKTSRPGPLSRQKGAARAKSVMHEPTLPTGCRKKSQ